eukprot:jgi/Galph1/3980/GphlegSOOS_G2637.1
MESAVWESRITSIFHFGDLSLSSNEASSKAYRVIFRTLGPSFLSSYVFCVIAGRVDRVVLRQDTRCSPIIFLPLDPFPCQSVHYIMEHSLYNQTPIQQIRFPSNRQELDRCSRVIWDYTGGVPIYVSYVLSEWTKSYYNKIPMIRFISHLFSTIIPSDSPVGGGLKLEILFSLVVYLKLCFCSNLGEISIFQKTFMENYLLVDDVQSRKRIPLPQYVTSFNSSVSGDASTADTTYHPNAWNIFYDVFLSKEDGIFIPFSQYSKVPDLIIRLSKNVTEETISPSQVTDSTQLVTFSSQQGPIVYLIGISLKCYHLAGQGAGLSLIKNETEKFLIPEAKNIVAIRLVVSTKYTKKVIRQFTDHQNWILNSGVYYENGNRQLLCQSLSSAPASGFANEWLRIPPRCQLVVCLTTSLQSFLGPEAYSQLEHVFRNEDAIQSDSKLFPLSSALTSWLQEMLRNEPKSRRVGFGMEMRSDANAMQVGYTREAQSAAASSSMDLSIDWKSFFLHEVRLDENRVNEYISKLPPAPVSLLKYITFQDLMRSGLKEEDVMKILFGLRKVSANH